MSWAIWTSSGATVELDGIVVGKTPYSVEIPGGYVPSARLGMGGIGLSLLLVAEFGLVLWLRGISIREYLATRDPVSGAVYYVLLGVFAIMPLLVARR